MIVPSAAVLGAVADIRRQQFVAAMTAVGDRRSVAFVGPKGMECDWMVLALAQRCAEGVGESVVLLRTDVSRKALLQELASQLGCAPKRESSCEDLFSSVLRAINVAGQVRIFVPVADLKPQVESDLAALREAGAVLVLGAITDDGLSELVVRCHVKLDLGALDDQAFGVLFDVLLKDAGKTVDDRHAVMKALKDKTGGRPGFLRDAIAHVVDVKFTKDAIGDVAEYAADDKPGFFGVLVVLLTVGMLGLSRYAIYYAQASRAEKVLTASAWVIALLLKFAFFSVFNRKS